ncbi:MAG: hypothetical protein IJZ29_00330 [Clostridia bacterium]|nr:hypothetical protein [Clostridia bacterium]
MKHCKFCNINIENKKVHCPLCGKCLDEEKVKSGIVNHSDIYPDNVVKSNLTNVICKIFTSSLFVLTLLCLGIDLLVNYKVSFSLIVIIGFIYSYFVIFRPIRKNMPLENFFVYLSFFTPLFILFIELYTKTFGWGVNITVPALLLGLSVASLIIISVKGFADLDMIKPIIINTLLITVLLILLFIFKQPTLITIISFLLNIAIVLFVLIFRFKLASKSIKKEFRF